MKAFLKVEIRKKRNYYKMIKKKRYANRYAKERKMLKIPVHSLSALFFSFALFFIIIIISTWRGWCVCVECAYARQDDADDDDFVLMKAFLVNACEKEDVRNVKCQLFSSLCPGFSSVLLHSK